MVAMDPVRIGVIGLGAFGRLHALTLAGLTEAQLVALVAPRQQSIDEVCRELPQVRGWTDLDQAIRESGAEAWVVASSTASHVPITQKLLEANSTVLLEKPIADSLDAAQSLAPLVADDSRNLMLGHILLFNSEFLELQEQARQRGPIVHLDAIRHRPSGTLERFPGESPFHLTMVHDLYCALALMGRTDPSTINAQVHRNQDGQLDLALAELQWNDGCLARFAAGFIIPPGMAPDGFDRLEVYGRGWMARLKSNPRPIELWDTQARWPMALEIRADPGLPTGMLAQELRYFCRVVRGLAPVPIGATYHDAMRVQRWLDQLEASVR